MSPAPSPIIVCYDGSAEAARAIEAAGTLFPHRSVIVLYVSSPPAAERVRTTSVVGVREELIEEVRVAARRDAAAVAEEGRRLARGAGLAASKLTVESNDRTSDVIARVAAKESAAAVVVARPDRARSRLLSPVGVAHSILERCSIPVVFA